MKRCLPVNWTAESLPTGVIKLLFTVPVPLLRLNYLHLHHPTGINLNNQKNNRGNQFTHVLKGSHLAQSEL